MLDPTQKNIIDTLNVQPAIKLEEEVRRRVNFLKNYCRQSKSKGFVLGISGGQDSLLAGKLAQLARL